MTAQLPVPYAPPIAPPHAYTAPPMQQPMMAPPVVFMAQPQADFCPGPGAVGNFPGLTSERCNHGLWAVVTIVGGLLTFGLLFFVGGILWVIFGCTAASTNKGRIVAYNRRLSQQTGRPVPAGYPGAVYPR